MGPNYGANHRKLTPDQVVELRADYASGLPVKEISQRYDISKRRISSVVFGPNYKWVPGALPPEMKRQGRRG